MKFFLHYAQERVAAVNSHEVDRIKLFYAYHEQNYDGRNAGYLKSLAERDAHVKQLLGRLPQDLARCRVLDIGCGYGRLLKFFHEQGASADRLFGVDLLPHRIQTARKQYPSFTFKEGNAEHIDFPDNWFDVITMFTVFSSILDSGMAKNVALEATRVLAPGGVIVWYDMRYPNPQNPNVRSMTKARIHELFPRFELQLESLTLLPPLARRLGFALHSVYPVLATVPFLRSHYLGLLRSIA